MEVLGHAELPETVLWVVDWIGEYLSLEDLEYLLSPDGLIEFIESAFTMETGSSVWLTANVDIAESVNLFRFNLEFTSDLGAEGLLGVYLDDQFLVAIDERLVASGPHEYAFQLNDTSAGLHTLSFRLDPFGEIPSSILVSDLQWRSVYVVPEPSTLILVAPIVFLLVVCGMRRWRQSQR